MPRPLLPPRGVFVPSELIYNPDLSSNPLRTWIQLRGLAWGKSETPQLSMNQLLAGKWLLMTLVGIVQVTIMFAWAQLAFGVDLVGHLPGFAVMTAVTAAAASSFALTLAAVCRNRAQLNAVSVILILCMSALGGSMVPRYVMSETMQQVGKITFNAWALDGYIKVFWRNLPLRELAPELTVLAATAIVLFAAARVLARRWESS